MKTKKFKQCNRVLGKGKNRIHGYENNKNVFTSMWKLSFLERLALLFTGTIWITIDGKTFFHRPKVIHPFLGDKSYKRTGKRGFTPHGEQV